MPSDLRGAGKENVRMDPAGRTNVIQITGEKITLRLDRNCGSLSISRNDGKIRFGPILFWAGFRPKPKEKKFLFSTVVLPDEPEPFPAQDTPVGKADLVRWPIRFGQFHLTWEIATFAREDFALFRVRLGNQSDRGILVDELSPFSYRGAGDGLEMGAGHTVWKIFRLGYQSWSPSGSVGLLEPQPRPSNWLARRIGLAPYLWNRQADSVFSSEYLAEIVEPELDLGFLLGFVTSKDQAGIVEAEVKYERFRRFEAIADCEGVELAAGKELCSEWVMASPTDAPRSGQKRYFELWGGAMQARTQKPLTGWCSWYYYFTKISLDSFEQNLKQAQKLNPKIEMFQIDDGYQAAVGDWLEWNDKFPITAKELAKEIHAQGFKAGIWLAPFLASISSELYKMNPDWTLKNNSGWSKIGMINPGWEGKIAFALDTTHPGVQQWLRQTTEYLVKECGFDFLKLDFIYTAALPGKRFDPSFTGAQALRKGLEIIREAAGENCLILGCGAPLGPSVGIVDIMRVSPDTDRKWKNILDLAFGIALTPSLKSCLKNSLTRSLTNGRLWTLDPDCLLLGRGRGLKEAELKSQLILFHLLAGQVFLSEEISRLDQGQLRWFNLALPVAEKSAEPIDLFEREFPEQFFKRGEPISLLGLGNWSEEEKPCRINFARFGLKKRYHLFECWTWNYLGEAEGKVDLGVIPPHSVRYFGLTEAGPEPRIIGLDFHLGMGAQGAELKPSDSGSGLRLKVSLPGKRQGKVWIKFPEQKEPKAIELSFEDRTELEV